MKFSRESLIYPMASMGSLECGEIILVSRGQKAKANTEPKPRKTSKQVFNKRIK